MKTKYILSLLGLVLVSSISASVIFAIINITATISVTEPISPTSYDVSYTCNPGAGSCNPNPTCLDFGVTNSASVPLNVTAEFTETMNPYGAVYTPNEPFNQTLNPGTNTIHTCITWTTNFGGSTVYGNVTLTRI